MPPRRYTPPLLLVALLLAMGAGSGAQLTLTSAPPPLVRAAEVLVPLAFLREQMGCTTSVSETGLVTVRFWGHSFAFEVGKTAASRTGRRALLATPPERVGEQVFVPLGLITEAVGFRSQLAADRPDAIVLEFPDAKVLNCRVSADAEKVRVVYDLSSAVPFQVEALPLKVFLTIPARPADALASRYEIADPICSAATLDLAVPDRVRTAVRANYRATPTWFTLSGPSRIVVDVSKLYEHTTTREVAPGIEWTATELGTGAGPMAINVARIDLRTEAYDVKPVMAGDTIFTKDATSRVALRAEAVVAVNGGFFATEGPPLGLVVVDRELVRTPVYSRTCLGLTAEGEAHIGRVSAQGYLRLQNNARLPITKLNGTPDQAGGLYLFTRWWDLALPVSAGRRCLTVSEGKVIRHSVGGAAQVPANGYLAVGTGQMTGVLGSIPPGSPLWVHFDTASDWASMQHALGAGPMLVRNGREFVSSQGERFRRDVTVGRSPRTAVGITTDQQLLLLTVDGRRPGYSVGMTLRELARYLVKLGANEAMNLDGGGSTTFAVDGRLRNRPSGGSERRVSNVLAVVPRR